MALIKNVKVSSYLENLGKSLGYIGYDVLKSYAPTMVSLGETTKEGISSGYQAIKDFTSSSSDSDFSFKGITGKAGEFIKNTWNNTIDDLKTGKIYNKERSDALGSEIASGFLGDMDFSFDFDDDWGDTDDMSETDSTKAQVSAQVQSSREIISAVDAMGRGLSASMTEATTASASYIADSARENSKALFNLNKQGFGAITKALMSVNETIYGFSKIGEPLTAHMQNSLLFFTKTQESLSDIQQTLKEIAKNTTPAAVAGQAGYKKKKSIADMISDDTGIDFGAIKESITESINEYKDLLGMFTGLFSNTAKNGDKNLSPLALAATAGARYIIPNQIKGSLKSLDDSIKYGLGAGLTKLRGKQTGNFLVDMLLDMIPGRETKKDIHMGNYEKGPLQWDGIARKALIDVIPTTLLQIYSAITNTEPMRFDYNSGKFVKTSALAAEFNKKKREYIEASGGDFYKKAQRYAQYVARGESEEEKKRIAEEVYKYFEKAFETGEHNVFASDNGIDPEVYAKIIKRVASDNQGRSRRSRKFNNKWVVESNEQAARFADYLRSQEASGYAALQMTHNELTGEGKSKGTKNTIIGLDEYGHNYYWYLQGIWQYTGYIAHNLGAPRPTGSAGLPDLNGTMPTIPSAVEEIKKVAEETRNDFGYSGTEEDEYNDKKKEKRNKIKEWLDEKLSKPAKRKINKFFGRSEDMEDDQFFVVGLMDKISTSIDTLLFGTADNPEGGLFSNLFDKSKSLFDEAKDWLKENIFGKVKEKWGNLKKKMGESNWWQETKGVLGNVKDSMIGTTKKIFIGEDNGEAAHGRKVTKTGIVTVSEGELIIPSEFNPFYHGITDKAAQIRKERQISRGRFPMFTNGTQGVTMDGDNGFTMRDPTVGEKIKSKTQDVKSKFESRVKDNSVLGLLYRGAKWAFSGVKEALDDMADKDKIKEDAKNISEGVKNKFDKILTDIGGAKGQIGAGAILGAGASILTGGIINPLVGAALGAGVGLLTRSKNFQDLIFGPEEEKTDKDGKKYTERKRQKLYDFFQNQFPDVAKGAGLGMLGGTLLGSPVAGAFIGAGLGFVTKSKEFKDWLFGEEDEKTKTRKGGVISSEAQQKLKKALPAMAVGAVAGGALGPLGLIPNMLLGSTIGFSASVGKLNETLFGKKDEKTGKVNREGSVLWMIKEKLFGNIDTLFHNISNRLTTAFKGFARDLKLKITGAVDWIKEKIANRKGKLGKLLGGIYDIGDKVLNSTIKLPFRIAGGIAGKISDKVQKGNLKKGYGVYNRYLKRNMNARERLANRKNLGIKVSKANKIFDNFDKFLESIKSYEELTKYKEWFRILKTTPEDSADYKATLALLEADPKWKEFAKNNIGSAKQLTSFFKGKLSARIEGLIKDEEGSGRLSAEKDKENREKSVAKTVTETIPEKMDNLPEKIAAAIKGESDSNKKSKRKKSKKKNKSSNNNNTFDKNDINEDIESEEDDTIEDDEPESGGTVSRFLNRLMGKDASVKAKKKIHIDMFGNVHEYTRDEDGKWTEVKNDSDTKESRGVINKFIGSITSIPNVFGTVMDKLFGKGDEEKGKKPGILRRLFNFLGDLASKAVTFLTGVLAPLGLFAAGGTILYKALFGDGFWNNLTNSIGSLLGLGDSPNHVNKTITTTDGTVVTPVTDANGKVSYVDANGNVVSANSIISKTTGGSTFTDNVKNGFIKRTVKGHGLFALPQYTAKWAAKHPEAASKIVKGAGKIDNALEVIGTCLKWFFDNIIKHIPGIGKLAEKAGGFISNIKAWCKEYFRQHPETIAKVNEAGKSFLKALNIITLAYDFTTGMQNARNILGITDKPTLGQQLACGLLKTVKNCIPIVGIFIPEDWIIDQCVKLGFFKDLKEQRESGELEVQQYNKQHGTNYTLKEYNDIVQHDVSGKWFTNALDSAKASKKAGGSYIAGFARGVWGTWEEASKAEFNNVNKAKFIKFKAICDNLSYAEKEKYIYVYDFTSAQVQELIDEGKITAEEAATLVNKGYYRKEDLKFNTNRSEREQFIDTLSGINKFKVSFAPIKKINETISQGPEACRELAELLKDKNSTKYAYFKSLHCSDEDIKKYIKMLEIAADKSSTTNTATTTNTSESGGASGLAISGRFSAPGAFQSQYDPKYSNIKFANSTISEAGCGPAVAAMASTLKGGNLNMANAIEKAKPYTNNDGTSVKYFEDVLKARRLDKQEYVESALTNGRPVILLGRDPSNTDKNKSPFGPNSHYVLALGMNNGKVLVNDPEAHGPALYDKSILRKSNYSMGYGGRSLLRGRGMAKNDVADQLWAALKKHGFSDAAAAGFLGNVQQESSMNSSADSGPAYGLFQFEKATGNADKYFEYAASTGRDRSDPAAQLDYVLDHIAEEMSTYSGMPTDYYSSGAPVFWPDHITIDDFKKLTDPELAAEIMERTYERASLPMMEQRKQYAKEYYDIYKGTNGTSEGGTWAQMGNQVQTTAKNISMMANLKNLFGSLSNIYDFKNGFHINDIGGDFSSALSTGSDIAVNTTGAQAAINAAMNEVGYEEQGNNITKFGKWAGVDGNAWCAAFATWAIAQAFGDSKDKALAAMYNPSSLTWCPDISNNFKDNNRFSKEPHVGDLVFYGNWGDADHVGLVTSVDPNNKTYTSVEGNWGDAVKIRENIPWTGPDGGLPVEGFGSPNYDGASAAISSSNKDISKYVSTSNESALGSGLRGGSSGLLRKLAPSKYVYGKLKGQKLLSGKASGIKSTNRFRGAGTENVTATLTKIKDNLTKVKNNRSSNSSNSSGIDPSLVTELLASITKLLDSIATNTAPTEKIYAALSEYIDYVKGNNKTTGTKTAEKVQIPTNSEEVDGNLANLVATLSAIAAG